MKTAVEWLINELQKAGYIDEKERIMLEVIKIAKEMEKQQMLRFYHEGSFAQMRYFDGKGYVKAEQYYNETFKSE